MSSTPVAAADARGGGSRGRHARSTSSKTISLALGMLAIASLVLPASAELLNAENIPSIPGVNFDFSQFTYFENGFDSVAGALTLFWSTENEGSPNEILHGALMFNGTAAVTLGKQTAPLAGGGLGPPTLLNSWFSIAFGRSMLTADFLLVYINTTGGMSLFNLSPTGNFQTPITNPGPKILTDAPRGQSPHVSFHRNGIALVEFRRFTIPRANDNAHAIVYIDEHTDVIWAYNINPDSTPATTWATYHGLWRGAYQIRFKDGDAYPVPEANVGAKKIHGLGMFIVWQVLFPLGIYWGRYARSIALINAQWMWVHIGMQIAGSIATSVLTAYICLNLPSNIGPSIYLNLSQRPHPIIGFVLMGGIVLQVFLGVLNRLGLQIEALSKFRPLYRGLHDWFGRILLILSISQVALGINTVYPWPDALPSYTGRGFVMWMAYFCITGAWLIAFFFTEVYWIAKVQQRDRGLVTSKTGRVGKVNAKGVDPGRALASAAKKMNVPEKSPLMEMQTPGRMLPAIKAFTWEDIDSELQLGQMFVVANGRYVYDIQNWIWSHPGGQIILYSVAGTDITNDYFHEAGFDAEAFVPAAVAQRRARSHLPNRGGHGPLVAPGESLPPPPSYMASSAAASIPSFPSLSEAEWRQVVKARRPHVHSRLAIEKLSTLLVGELVGPDGQPLFLEGNGAVFSGMEYRRFAIVDSVLESGAGTAFAVYKIKFCILYPHDTRVNEPKVFMPGQCVEIQARVNNRYISRYFTPISGSPSCFEVMIKLEPQGALTPFLIRQKPGDRQIRVRGPFGTPAVNPERPFDGSTGEWAHRRIVFITAGSGLAPALQMVQFLFLPTYVPVYAYQSYEASNTDEISIYAGDWVIARTHLLDGWAEGVNLRTNQEGIFPLPITYPRCGPGPLVGVLHSIKTPHDAFGSNVLQGAMLAYPEQIRVTTTVTRGSGGGGYGQISGPAAMRSNNDSEFSRVAGQVMQGRITVDMLTQTLVSVGWPCVNGQFGGGYGMDQEMALSRIVVCGPKEFEGFVYETMVDILGVPHQNITMLPDNQYL
ncbi:hypothetical protein HDU67_000599 [Dinochytrium kinnereticum]|nr:hypothetical protein HDU67_000599 [Dinochytrium kinnereticum]